MSPFQVYCEYLALKSHFSNSKYDYFRYNKKVKATIDSFNRRKDKYYFERISRKYQDKEIVNFLLSNFISSNDNVWIGEIIKEGDEKYKDWKKRVQSLSYIFKEQSEKLFEEYKLNEVFDCSKGHPVLLKKYLKNELSLETLVIYNQIFDYVKNFDKKLIDPIWEMTSKRIKKYTPFLDLNINQYKKVMVDLVLDRSK